MIPPTLDAFRKLMQRVIRSTDYAGWDEADVLLASDIPVLRALGNATPAQLLGIVGDCQHPHGDPVIIRRHSVIVTPLEDSEP